MAGGPLLPLPSPLSLLPMMSVPVLLLPLPMLRLPVLPPPSADSIGIELASRSSLTYRGSLAVT